ncbi:MAG: type II toxin-antitoxin system RelE family toxin [Nitrospiraceae bacterium]
MSAFSVQLTKHAGADLDGIPEDIRLRIVGQLAALAANTLSSRQAKKRLKGFEFPLYRLRVGDYRVLYRIDARLITVMRVIDRKDLDRIAKRLKLSPPPAKL